MFKRTHGVFTSLFLGTSSHSLGISTPLWHGVPSAQSMRSQCCDESFHQSGPRGLCGHFCSESVSNTRFWPMDTQKWMGLGTCTLLETNTVPENRPSQKEIIVFQPSIFRCKLAVSFRECFCPASNLASFLGINSWNFGVGINLEIWREGWKTLPVFLKLTASFSPVNCIKKNESIHNLPNTMNWGHFAVSFMECLVLLYRLPRNFLSWYSSRECLKLDEWCKH